MVLTVDTINKPIVPDSFPLPLLFEMSVCRPYRLSHATLLDKDLILCGEMRSYPRPPSLSPMLSPSPLSNITSSHRDKVLHP